MIRKEQTVQMKIYENSARLTIGITLKNKTLYDDNNMAFTDENGRKNIIQNRKNVAEFLNTDLQSFVCANQTHSHNFYEVTRKDLGRGAITKDDAIDNVDALYTKERHIVLGTLAADCVPVLFYHKNPHIIGVIHSGWRGTVNEITSHLFKYLINNEYCKPENFTVYIACAISQEKFAVDEDVYKKFMQLKDVDRFIYYDDKSKKYFIDNKRIVSTQCEKVGILPEKIRIDPMCTYIDERGFSYRENKTNQRHLGFIMRR